MSPVLPLDTQRYHSGDCTLEVTVHRSPLSAWSDRPVVRQLRFNLWLEQPQRRRLATGQQQQLVALSAVVDSYVQEHLRSKPWPSTHHLTLLNRSLSTLQLFDLSEVLSAYGQQYTTLSMPARRRRSRWWVGSTAASMLAAVGIAYVYSRPVAFNEVATTQAPEEVILDQDVAIAPETVTGAEAERQEATPETDEVIPETNARLEAETPANSQATPPLEQQQQSAERQPAAPAELSTGAEPLHSAPVQPAPSEPALSAEPDISAAESDDIETSAVEPEASVVDDIFIDESITDLEARRTQAPPADDALLAAIADRFAPYQPADTPYPVSYQVSIGPDGTILAVDPSHEQTPAIIVGPAPLTPAIIVGPAPLTPAPGRFLKLEVTYTGASRPLVQILP